MTKPEDRDRNYYAQYTLEGKGEYYEDAGHFISSQDGGDAGKINLSAQEKHVNQRDYRAFERENHAMLEQGNYVHLKGKVSYPIGSDINRPSAYMVERTVKDKEGKVIDHTYVSFTNADMAEFENVGESKATELMKEFDNPGGTVYDEEHDVLIDLETGSVIQ